MTPSIDLDLVELRCKLRGWTIYSRQPGEICVIVPERPGYAGAVICANGADVHETGQKSADILTAPRWTLDRLLSEPPEGWRVVDHVTPRRRYWQALLAWGESYSEHNHELSCALGAHPQSLLSVTVNQTCASHADLARLAERHKAAAELALILAEVEP